MEWPTLTTALNDDIVLDPTKFMIAYKYGLGIVFLSLHIYIEQVKNFEKSSLSTQLRDTKIVLLSLS